MTAQHVLDHFEQIEFWQRLLRTAPSENMDACDVLAINAIVERIRGNNPEQIRHLIECWIERDYDPTQPLPAPTVEAVYGRSNELAGLFLKAEGDSI